MSLDSVILPPLTAKRTPKKPNHIRVNFRFSGRKSQNQQNLAKKTTHFTIQFHSKTSLILQTSTQSTL